MSYDNAANMQLLAKQPHVGLLESYCPGVVIELELSLSLASLVAAHNSLHNWYGWLESVLTVFCVYRQWQKL
jgi:hypothetical protein